MSQPERSAHAEVTLTWGGEGERPGEFWWLNYVAAWPGDSIVAWFPRRGRISVFDSDGSYGRSFGVTSDCSAWCPSPLAARRDGTILTTREYDFPGEERPAPLWTVCDPEGRVPGFVETPPGLRIFEIGADYILGRVRDEPGVESVQVWPMSRSG